MTAYLGQLLEAHHGLDTGLPMDDWLRRLKEADGFVSIAVDTDSDNSGSSEQPHNDTENSFSRLSDSSALLSHVRGTDLSGVATLLGECTELLFDPRLGGFDIEGVVRGRSG